MSASQASKSLAAFQSFVQTNIPSELGGTMTFARGSVAGSVTCIFTGALYGSASSLNRIIHPLLAKLPKPMSSHVRSGTYIQSVEFSTQGGSLNTSSLPDVKDTFYAKSLMVPEASLMSHRALDSFTSYMANEGFNSKIVRPGVFSPAFLTSTPTQPLCLFPRTGSVKSTCTEGRILK